MFATQYTNESVLIKSSYNGLKKETYFSSPGISARYWSPCKLWWSPLCLWLLPLQSHMILSRTIRSSSVDLKTQWDEALIHSLPIDNLTQSLDHMATGWGSSLLAKAKEADIQRQWREIAHSPLQTKGDLMSLHLVEYSINKFNPFHDWLHYPGWLEEGCSFDGVQWHHQ